MHFSPRKLEILYIFIQRISWKMVVVVVLLSLIAGNINSALAMTTVTAPHQGETIVEPASVAYNLEPGSGQHFTLSVKTADIPIPKVDVLFLFDVTSSMREEIDQAKARGREIMSAVNEQVPDSAFGVASFSDYPGYFSTDGYASNYGGAGDYPWRLDQDITNDFDQAQSAINRLVLVNGEDAPEAYSRALLESVLIKWRDGAKHIIVLFGDSVAHDPTFYIDAGGENTGIDLGMDGEIDTDDDLTFVEAVDQVKERGIEIIPVNSDLSGERVVQAGFEYMAEQTGGKVYPLPDATELASKAIEGLYASAATINKLSLAPETGFENWVSFSPSEFLSVGGGENRAFEVTITVPADASPKNYQFPINVSGDGAALGATQVSVNVGLVRVAPGELRNQKQELIGQLSGLKYSTTVLGIPYETDTSVGVICDAPVHLSLVCVEEDVAAWLKGLSPETSPAQFEALYRMTAQEQSFYDLWDVEASSSHAGNLQITHVVYLVYSALLNQNKLNSFVGKNVVGLLASKVKNYITAKLITVVLRMIKWLISGIDNPDAKVLAANLEITCIGVEEQYANALKTVNFKESFNESVFKKIIIKLFVSPLDQATQITYLIKTGNQVDQGLSMAKSISAGGGSSASEAELADAASRAASQVTPLKSRSGLIKDRLKDITQTQAGFAVGENVADLISSVMIVTGAASWLSSLFKLVSVAIRAADAVMSSTFAIDAYKVYLDGMSAVPEITNIIFPSYTPLDSLSARLGNRFFPVSMYVPRDAFLGNLRGIGSVDSAADVERKAPESTKYLPEKNESYRPVLSEYSLTQLESLHAQTTEYTGLLSALADSVRRNDTDQFTLLVEKLMDADQTLSASFMTVEQPIYAGAPELVADESSSAFQAYANVGKDGASFLGEGAKLYAGIIAWGNDPADGEIKQMLLDQIDASIGITEKYEASIQTARPFVEGLVNRPFVVISRIDVPENSIPGSGTIKVEVSNTSPGAARETTLSLITKDVQFETVTKTIDLGDVPPGDRRSIKMAIPTNLGAASAIVRAEISNGMGDSRVIILPFTPNTGGSGVGGIGVLVILLILGAGGTFIYVTHQKNRRGGAVRDLAPRHACKLVQTEGVGAGREILIPSSDFLIGRGATCDLQLQEISVSRRHARLRFARSAWYIQDLGSKSGTFVNGKRLNATRLTYGDLITIGSSTFIFREN